MTYHYRAARQRQQELIFLYRRAKHAGADDMTLWALAAQIEELEQEINEAHKKTTAGTVAP